MIDPRRAALFIPSGLRAFKLDLFNRIGRHIKALGGMTFTGDPREVEKLPPDTIPIIGCTPPFRSYVAQWKAEGRTFLYWDRGYLRRVFATWLPNGHDLGVPGGYYRWEVNAFQMKSIRDVPDDRWRALQLQSVVKPWKRDGAHIVIADTGFDYWDLHADRDWSKRMAQTLRSYTDRKIIIRDKESKLPLAKELHGAHCLVTHGSVAAVEAVVLGCPVFVSESSAACLVGETDFSKIESPLYPERQQWLNSLAYSQFNESELIDGTLWRLLQ